MKKSIQKVLIGLSLVLMLSISVFFVACGPSEMDTTLSINKSEITMVLNEDQTLNETDVEINLSADNTSVWYHVSNNEVLTVDLKQSYSTRYVFTVKALKVGECDITFVSTSNANQKVKLKVRIEERVTAINFVNETDIYLTQGTKYMINAKDLQVLPNAGLINQVEYSIDENRYGLTISKDGLIDASQVVTNCRCEITAKSKFDENIISKTYVSVISGLNANAVQIINKETAEVIYSAGQQMLGIELVKSNALSSMLLDVGVSGYSVDDLDYSTSVNGTSLQTSVASGELYLQSTNVGKSIVSLFIVPTIASKYVEPLEIKLEVQVIDLPNSILLNGVKVQGDIDPVAIYDYYDDGFIGTRLNFQVYPEASDNAYIDEIEIAFENLESAGWFNFYVLKNGIPVKQTLENGVLVVESGTELYVRAEEITDLSNIYHKLTVTSVKARDYGIEVSQEIFLELKKGIQSISVPEEIRLKVDGFSIENIEVYPQNADPSQISIRTSSSKIEAIKNGPLTFKVTANEVTDEEYIYFTKPNGSEVKCKVVVYESLKSVTLEMDDVVTGKVSKKEYINNMLDSAVVKIGYEIGIKYSYNQGATITKIELTSTQSTGISLDRNKNTFTCLQPGNYIVGVTVHGYSDEGYDYSITRQVKIEAYKAIKTLTINKSNATCYTANSVGYYKSSSLSVVNLSVQAYPLDAKEGKNVTWTLTDENGDFSTVGTLLGSSTSATYQVSTFDADQTYVIATATINQYGETFSISCRIKVENAIMVNQILVTNVSNNNLYFDSRTSIDSKETFEIKSIVYPSSALNKNVRYEYRTIDDKISSNPIFKLTQDGKITPLRAGKAKVLICAEDSYTSSTEAKIYSTVYVTIQDGKSEETAFHISSASELLEIGESAEKMSYYYQLTQNIDLSTVQNFAPIGSAKKLAFTGKISGKNSFQFGNSQNAEDNMVFRYYTISGINLDYKATNSIYAQKEDFVGLFYKIAPNETVTYDGMPTCGTITDLSIEYDSLNVDLSLFTSYDNAMGYFSHYIGGVAGAIVRPQSVMGLDDYVSLQNVKVRYNKFSFAPGKHIAYIGGLVGAIKNSNIAFNDDCKGALVSGNDIIVAKGTDTLNSEYYIGGLVGLNENSTIKSRFDGIVNAENQTKFSTSFENDNIDVIINICNSFQIENYQGSIVSTNSALGGIAGIVRGGKISNCSTENLMFGRNNIGGIAGIMFGGEIENSLSASKLRGISSTGEFVGENIGGIVGKVTDLEVKISSTFVQSYDDGKLSDNELQLIKGKTNLGGIIGLAESKFVLEFVYSATYITRELTDSYVGDIYSKVQVLGDVNLGGIVGCVENVQSVINKCYTNLVLCADSSRFYSFTGGAVAQISNSYIENLVHHGIVTPSAPASQIQNATNSFFVALLDDGNYSFLIKGNSYTEIPSTSLSDLDVSLSFAGFNITEVVDGEEMQVWDLENNSIPYLNYGTPIQTNPNKYFGLVELAPVLIEAKAVDSADSLMQRIYGTNVLILEFNKALDNQMQSKLEQTNTFAIADYIKMQTTPQDGYTKRFIVESDNQNILRITQNGEFKLVNVGLVKVTIKSKLNINKYDVVYVQIIYGSNGMNVYENQSSENSSIKNLVMYKKQEKQIYPTLIDKPNFEKIQTQIETGIKIEYSFDADVSTKLSIGNAENVADYNEVHVLKALEATQKDILMTVRPYYLVQVSQGIEIKLYLQDVFANKDAKYDAENIKIKILLGATNVNVIQSSALLVRAGEEAETTVRVFTTLEYSNEEIIYSIYDTANLVADRNDFIISHEKITNEQTLLENGYIDFRLRIALKGNARDIASNTAFTIRVTPESNYSISTSFSVEFYPAVIDRMETQYYTYGFKNSQGYNKNEEARDMILPGQTGILVLDVMPFYSNYDYIEVTYEQNLGLGQVYFIPGDGSAYPYAEYSNLTYLSKGIRLANISSDEKGVISFGKTGKYYITINAPTNTLVTSYSLTISAFKQGVTTEKVFSMTKTLGCINLPVIELGYRGENSKEIQEIFIPRGVKDTLDVSIHNADAEPKISIKNVKTGSNYIYATINKVDGKYKIEINENASIGDQLKIIFECEKVIGEDVRVITQELELIVVPYLINDIGFEYVTDGTMREQFGGSFRLAISFEKSSFFYDERSEEVKAMIISDLEKVNTYDYNTWYAYRESATGKDYSLGSYYENDYLEIKTRSNLSKDLYVSGKFYDELETNQKILGAYIKYYFDKSAKCWVFNKLVKTTTNRKNANAFEFHSTKNLQNGRYYFEQSKFFKVSFYMSTSMENAKPIYNKQEFQEMQSGMSYILMRDLELTNFKPITNQIAYLNGNNKTITIQSFATDESISEYGIFASIANNAIVENLKIAIPASNLNVDLTNKSSVVFGLLTAENSGKIYNCSISYLGIPSVSTTMITTVINGKEVRGTEEYIASLLSEEDNTSGNVIPKGSKGLILQISVVRVGEGFVSSTMGGLVGNNYGYITNCRIEDGLSIHGYGDIGGLVGKNSGTIASSYSLAQLNSYSTVEDKSSVGGFVGVNSGKISLSYVEARNQSANGVVSQYSGINAICFSGGFVCENTGTISNCYSNLTVTSNSSTAGFVYDNNKGKVSNSYSASRVRQNSKRDATFVGVDTYNQINNDGNGITDCYFLGGNYANQDLQPAQRLTKEDFANREQLSAFAFDKAEGFTSNGVWFIPTSANGASDYIGQNFIPNMPTLVSANLVSKGYVELLSTTSGEDGNPKYNYSAIIGATLGSNSHPYVIYNAEQLNKYVAEARDENSNNTKSYLLASDITFDNNAKMAETYFTNFKGKFEGNAMVINKLRISYLVATSQGSTDLTNIGLFKELDGATIQNLSFDAEEVYGSAVERVGTLAGTIKNSRIFGIDLNGSAVLQGKNLVGALAGYVGENNQILDIHSTISVNSVYKTSSLSNFNLKPNNGNYSLLSYGGGILGYVDNQSNISNASIIKNLKISQNSKVLGDVVGGIAGYVGENNKLENCEVEVSEGMMLKGVSAIGGIAGINQGRISNAKVHYAQEIQNVLDNMDDVTENSQKSGIGSLSNIAINDFFNYSQVKSNERRGVIGGIAGINAGNIANSNGIIENTFNKVNIVDNNAKVLGGLIGINISGKLDLCYSTSLIDFGYMQNAQVKYVGGLIGLNSTTISEKLSNIYSGEAKTEIINSVSIATFNYDSQASYHYEMTEGGVEKQHYALAIGAGIGLLEKDCVIEFNNFNFNKQIIASGVATTTHDASKDVTLYAVGRTGDNNNLFITLNLEDDLALAIQTTNHVATNPHLYVQMVSDGKKVLDDEEKYYTYEELSKGVTGNKTEIFAPFFIENFFEFPSIALEDGTLTQSAFPSLKGVRKLYELNELFSTEGNIIYLQGSDLVKVALIANSNNSHWKKYDYFNGYILKLQTNMQLSPNFIGINQFKATLDGNGKTISGLTLTNSVHNSFIKNGIGAQISKVQFNEVVVDIQNANNANFGLFASATNLTIETVSINYSKFNIVNSNTNVNFGSFAGNINGSYNYIVKSYVNFASGIEKLECNAGAFVCTNNSNLTKLFIEDSYSLNSNNSTAHINLTHIPNEQIKANNVVVYNNTDGESKIGTGTNNLIGGSLKNYEYNKNSGNLAGLFADDTKWQRGTQITNVWKESIWKFDSAGIPIHSFGADLKTIISSIGTYDEGLHTYTLTTAENLEALAQAINSGTIPNGGDGYVFKLGADINGNYYAVSQTQPNETYFIHDYHTSNPYIIYDGVSYDLNLAGNKLTGTIEKGAGANKEIITFNIKNMSLTAIGTDINPFRAIFDGNNKTISNVTVDAFISQNNVAFGGLFAKLQDATIGKFNVQNVAVNLNMQKGQKVSFAYLGILSGMALSSSILNVNIKGTNSINVNLVNAQGGANLTQSETQVKNLYAGSILGFANTIELLNINKAETNALNVAFNKATEIELENQKLGDLIGYMVRNQSYIGEKTIKNFNLSSTESTFGEIIETNRDEFNHAIVED